MQLDEIANISHSSDSSQFFAVIIANPTSGNVGFPHHNHHFDDTLTFLRDQGTASLTAEQVAQRLGTINYEVVSEILARVPRVD